MTFGTYRNINSIDELKQHLRGKFNTMGYTKLYFTSEGDAICNQCFTNRKKRRSILECFESGIVWDFEDHYETGFCNCWLCNREVGGMDTENC